MNLGQRLKSARKKLGLTQSNVARQLSISRQAISQWENDHSYPDIDNLIRLCKLYHFNLNELIDM